MKDNVAVFFFVPFFLTKTCLLVSRFNLDFYQASYLKWWQLYPSCSFPV